MKVTDIIVTKHEGKANTYQARVEATTAQTVNIALPMFTTGGMTDKINTSRMKYVSQVKRSQSEVVTVDVTKEQARELVEIAKLKYGEDEMKKRYEQQSDDVVVIRL